MTSGELIAVHRNGAGRVELAVPDLTALVPIVNTPLCASLVAVNKFASGIRTISTADTGVSSCMARRINNKALGLHQLVAGSRDGQAAGIERIAVLVLQDELHDGLLAGEAGIARGGNLLAIH